MNEEKKIKLFDGIITLLCALAYSIPTFILFYRQNIVYGGQYNSDSVAYLNTILGVGSEYEFPYPLMFVSAKLLAYFMPVEIALAVVVTILNTMTFILVSYYLKRYASHYFTFQKRIFALILCDIFGLSLLGISMVFLPGGLNLFGLSLGKRCAGVFSPNPYWNATGLCVRPFTIVNFFVGCRILGKYDEGVEKKDYIIFTISLLLATLTKPSYTLVVTITCGIIMLVRLVKSRFHNIRQTILFGLTFIPAGLDCIYQYFGVFTGVNSHGEESGVAIGFGVAWHTLSNNIPLSIIFAGLFAIWMLLTNIKKLRTDMTFRFSWELYFTALFTFLILYEKGFRLYHCNFAWGYIHALFFVFLSGIFVLIQNTVQAKRVVDKLISAIGWAFYGMHLACGLKFALYLIRGGDFFLY